jgi:hypothetical protein
VLKGSITTGDWTRLAADDAVRVSIGAGVSGGQYYTDWYGYCVLDHPPLNLTVTYNGNFTISRTQTLYLWNWSTSAWTQINSATVSTSDVTKTWSTSSPANYVSGSREVRFRVKGNNNSGGSYTSRGDYMAFTYDYTSGTAPQLIARGTDPDARIAVATALAAPLSIVEADLGDAIDAKLAASEAHDAHAIGVGHAGEQLDLEALANQLPLASLRRVEGTPLTSGPRITWAVGVNEHVDGFNVYRENGAEGLQFVGNESDVRVENEEAVFRFVDRSGATGGTYWLGTRSCSGVEAMLGPIAIDGAAISSELSFAVSGNPARIEARFELSLPEEADVRLEMFDVQGRHLATPFAGHAGAGLMKADWNLRDQSGSPVQPGMYFARVQALGRTLFARVSVIEN